MICPFCNHEAVERPKIRPSTTRGGMEAKAKKPRKGWYCAACRRVFRGGGGGR